MKVLLALVAFATVAAATPWQSRDVEQDNSDSSETVMTHFYWQDENGNYHKEDLEGGRIEARADAADVTFYLYSKSNPSTAEVIKAKGFTALGSKTNFKASRKNVFIIHGWNNNKQSAVNTLIKSALLSKYDVNIFVVDWSGPANKNYVTAHGAVRNIGSAVGTFINKLMTKYSISVKNIQLIGHSLGAHVAGCAGATIKGKVNYIIGLDPAAPLFTMANKDNRLDPSDAEFVQVIHTNGALLGFSKSIGHVDYYPNGGKKQPGCGADLTGTCSHSRSYMYLAESIRRSRFTATRCGSYADFGKGKCSSNSKSFFGEFTIDKKASGNYFLNTNSKEPFAK